MARLALFLALGAALLALIILAPWNERRASLCAGLMQNIESVRSGHARAKVSDALIVDFPASGAIELNTERGDFPGMPAQRVRACLGAEWEEGAAHARGESGGTGAIAFRRDAWPLITVLTQRSQGGERTETRILIEAPAP